MVFGQQHFRFCHFSPTLLPLPSGEDSAQQGPRWSVRQQGRGGREKSELRDSVTPCSERCCGKWRPWQPGPRQKNVLQGRKRRGRQDTPSPGARAHRKARQPQVPSPQVTHAAGPLAPASLQQRGKGEVRREAQKPLLSAPPPSQLLQTAVHLPFALFPGPGPALGAELLQVFFEVLVVHGPVAGGLTVRLHTGEDEMRGPCLTRGSRLPPSGLARRGPSWRRAGPQTVDETQP